VNGEVLAGRYRLMAPLGQGGAGEVWRAEDLELMRPVAVKVLRRLNGDPTDTADRFRTEARAAARLSHPNVVTTYDVGMAAGQVFLVMELVAGRDLAQLLHSGGLPPVQQVADIARQAARALDAAHANGIVHRDVKPGNLLLAPDGTLKITDFGIAQMAGAAQEVGAAGPVLLGTAAYVSPEQVRGEPAAPASDWYSLGCVLYELVAGVPPFTADDVEGVLRQHIQAVPAPIQLRNPQVGPGLGGLVMRLLAKNPAERPASVAEIERLLDGAAVAPQPDNHTRVLPVLDELAAKAEPEPLQRAGVPASYRRAGIAAVAVLVLVVAAVLLRSSMSNQDAAAGPGLAPASTAAAKPSAHATTSRPSTTPKLTPTRTPSKPETTQPIDRVTALKTLAQLLRNGSDRKGSKAAREAARDLDQAVQALADGDTEQAAQSVGDARARLAEAQRDGRWEPSPAVVALLKQLNWADSGN
jgi:serine/threonine protein kinase